MKALPIRVYRNNSGYDCTNGGITSRYDDLLLICDEGFVNVDETNLPENLVKIVTRTIGGELYKHIEPYASVDRGNVGWMSGGNLAYACDSRFSLISKYPLFVHDRQETQKQYDMLFD